MIYCLDPTTTYPNEGQYLEEVKYNDENDLTIQAACLRMRLLNSKLWQSQ